MQEKVKPLYATAYFNVSHNEISYFLIFDYIDYSYYYRRILSKEEYFEKEIKKLSLNMQNFLDEEKVIVNGKRCRPEVKIVDIGFRGNYNRPYITFLITFKANIKKGNNFYENEYEPEIAEYDYKAYWYFPSKCKITMVEIGENYKIIDGKILIIYGEKGNKTSGYEMITFLLE